jgi:hypothetical protein
MHVKYKQDNFALYDMIYWYVQDNSHGLIIHVNFMVKCVCHMGLGSNGCFMTSLTLTGDNYRTNIISSLSHPRLDLVVPLVLCTVPDDI